MLNGGSSSGKSSIARYLQVVLPPTWLVLGVDDLIAALPPEVGVDPSLITFEPGGGVIVGPAFRKAEAAWHQGLAAMARSGIGVIVEDVFLGRAEAQGRLRSAFQGLTVLWVGVRCDATVAAGREATRSDRTLVGMAGKPQGGTGCIVGSTMTWWWTPRSPRRWHVPAKSPAAW